MNYSFYKITTKTNTHVGSGQNNYGIVDNIVQKDILSEYPCMHSTSLKGAMREYFDQKIKDVNLCNKIFGNTPKEKDDSKLKPGSHYFFQANLLSYPMRSNVQQYFNVTCQAIITNLKAQLELFDPIGFATLITELKTLENLNPNKNEPISIVADAIIEEHTIKTKSQENLNFSDEIKKIFGNHLAIMHNDDFNILIKKLPIIARNQLENGQSKNLFYEEVIPRETHFGFLIGANSIDKNFDKIIPFQIGANATVGYGFCELTKMI